VTLWIQHEVPASSIWQQSVKNAGNLRESGTASLWRAPLPGLIPLLAMNSFEMFSDWGLFSWMPAYLGLPFSEGGCNFQMLGVTSFLVTLNLVAMLPGYLLSGVLADLFGRRNMSVLFPARAALMVPWLAAARRLGVVLVSACFVAFFGTGFSTGSSIVGSELFPTPIRATALGITYNAARGISAFAPLIIGTTGQTRGLSWAFVLCGISFAAATLCALWIPETRQVAIA
jgi:MFS family permease